MKSTRVRLSLLSLLIYLLFTPVLRAQVPTVSNVAGGVPPAGQGTSASLEAVGGIGRDASGNVYFSSASGVILKLDTSGNISVFAGNGTCCFSGDGGPATAAQTSINPFSPVNSVKVDPSGNVYFVDSGACVVRMIPAGGGNITTVAGTPNTDFATFSNCNFGGDGQPATSATMSPAYIAFDPTGNMYIADQSVCVIRKVDHVTHVISTVAGNVSAGCTGSLGVGDGLPATSAQFVYPYGLAVDGAGNIYIGDFFPITGPGDVRKVDGTTNLVSTFGGGGTPIPTNGALATQTVFGGPTGLAIDSAGNVVIADTGLNMVMSENASTKLLTLLAGNFAAGPGFSGDAGPATAAQFHGSGPGGVLDAVIDASGTITITDTLNFRVRRVDGTTMKISTVAGNGSAGDGGPATSALVFAAGTAVDSSGDVYIADLDNGRVRKVDHTTGQISTVAGSDVGPTPAPSGDGGQATTAQLFNPKFPAVDGAGDIFVVENTTKVRRVDGGSKNISTYAGTGTAGYNGEGIAAASAQLNNARGLAANAAGDLYIADAGNQEVRLVDHTSQTITAVAGSHALGAGYSGDGGAATQARLNSPSYVSLDATGNLFIADRGNNVIRRVDATTQKISTVAGNFAMGAGSSGDGGPATMAQLSSPRGAAVDMYGNLYIADGLFSTNRMRVVNAVTGIITTLGGTGSQNFSGDGGPASSAGMAPSSVSVAAGAGGNILVYFSDALSGRARVITVPPVPAAYLVPGGGLTFGSQAIGTTSAPQTVTIFNSGTGTLNVSNVTTTGANGGDFVMVSGGTCAGTSFALAPTASCTVMVASKPLTTGPLTAAVSFTDDAGGSPHSLPITGTGASGGPVTCTISFNVASGNWETGTNWTPTGPPAMTDSACIPGGMAATIASSSPTVGALSVAGTLTISAGPLTVSGQTDLSGTINGTGNLTINGLLNWTVGTLGGGGTATLNGGTMMSSGNVTVDGRAVGSNSSAVLSAPAGNQLLLQNGAVWTQAGGTTFDVQNTGAVNLGTGAATFNNNGTFQKSTSNGMAALEVPLVNNGTFSVLTGTLAIANSGVVSGPGPYTVSSGAMVQFNDVQTISIPGTLSGGGAVWVLSGTLSLTGTYGVTGGTTIANSAVMDISTTGPVTLPAPAPGVPALTITQSGTLQGTADILVTGQFLWQGGTVKGTGAFTTTGGTLMNSGNVTLDGRTVTSNSSAALSAPAGNQLLLQNGAVWNQAATTTFDIQNTGAVNLGTGAATFNNNGTFQKSTSNGTATLGVPLVNNGTFSVLTGTLAITNSGVVSGPGPYTVAAGATLNFSNGGVTSSIDGSLTGAGSVTFGGGTTNINGTYNITGGTTTASGTGVVVFSGGTSIGPLTLTPNGAVTFGSTSTITSIGALNMNGGTITFNSATSPVLITSVVATNSTITGSDGITVSATSFLNSSTVSVTGTYTATGQTTFGAGGATIDGTNYMANGGTAMTGNHVTLADAAMYTNPGAALMDFQGNTSGFVQGAGALGSFVSGGTIQLSTNGTVSVDVPLNITGVVNLNAAGTMNFDGVGTIANTVNVAAGATLGLGANVGTGTLTFPVGSQIGGAGSVNFRLGTVNIAGGYSITGGTSVGSTGTYNFTGTSVVTATGPITAPSGTLNFTSTTAVPITSIHLTGGVISGSSNLNVAGPFTWDSGTVRGNGVSVATSGTLTASGGITLSGGTGILDGKTITANSAASPVTQSATGTLDLENGGVFNVAAGTTYNENNVNGIATSTSGVFNNAGTFTKAGVLGGAAAINVAFNNTGTVNVQVQEIDFNGGGTCAPAASCSGSYVLSSNTILGFNGGINNVGGSITVVGGAVSTNINALGGILNFATGASATGVSALFVNNTTTIASGVSLGIATVTVQSSGTLQGIGTINGALVNSGGIVRPAFPTGTPGKLTVTGNYSETGGGLFIELSATGFSQLMVGGTVTPGGTLDLIQDGGYLIPPGSMFTVIPANTVSGASTFFLQASAFPASPALGLTYTAPPGVVLGAAGGGPCTKTFNVASGTYETAGNWLPSGVPASTDFACIPVGNTATFSTAPVVAGLNLDGTLSGTGGGDLSVNGPANISSTGTLNGGAGGGLFTEGGTLTLAGGHITGSMNVRGAAGSTVVLNGGTVDTATFLIVNALNITASTTFQNGAAITTSLGSTATLADGASLLNGGGAAPLWFHQSTLTKLAGAAGSSINFNFDNQGTVTVAGGTLTFTGGGASTGTLTPSAGSTLAFGGSPATNFNLSGGMVNGAGTVAFASGTEQLGGTVNITGATQFSGGNVTIQAVVTNLGTIAVSGGMVQFGGGTTTSSLGAMTISGGSVTLATGQGAGVTFASVAINGTGSLLLLDTVNSPVTLGGGSLSVLSGNTGTINGTVTVNSGSLVLNGTSAINGNVTLNGGSLQGTPVITGNVNNAAGMFIVGPGLTTAGTVIVNGSFMQGAGGTLSFQFSGTTPGTGYSQLQVNGGNVTLGGTQSARNDHGFVFAGGQTFTVIAAGVPGMISGTFATDMLPTLTGSLTWTTTIGATTVTDTVNAPTPPAFNATPNPLGFGSQPEEVATAPMAITFTNTGGGTLTISSGLAASGDFKQVGGTCGALPINIVPGPGCTVTYTFTPTSAGTLESLTLLVTDNTATSPHTLTLTGTGIAPSPTLAGPGGTTSITFPDTMANTVSSPISAVLSVQAGTGTLEITSITLSMASTGTGTTQFAIQMGGTTTCPVSGGTLAGGASCTVGVEFTPTTTGLQQAQLNVTTSNFGSPTFPSMSLFLQGTGIPNTGPPVTITPTSSNGGNPTTSTILPGDTTVYTLVIQPAPGFVGMLQVACQELTPIPATIFTASPAVINVTSSPSGPITVTCTLQTNCTTALVGPRAPWGGRPWTPPPAAAVLLAAVLAAMRWRRGGSGRAVARQLVPVCGAVLLVVVVLTCAACVNNPKPLLPGAGTTPAGVYQMQIVVTATTSGGAKLPPVMGPVLTVHVI